MQVVLGSDHAGFELKKVLSDHLQHNEHLVLVLDVGTYSADPVDYPDYAEAVGMSILRGEAERGILICGSGVGACVAANKIAGIRAGLCHDCYSAHQGVEHDDVNVLVLGARIIGAELAKDLSLAFLNARFTNEERHQRRLKKILNIEERYAVGQLAKEKSL
jgi:RpiB/LacA/LacB family sugar-phosphate isomerase